MPTKAESLEPAFAEFQECVEQYPWNYVELLDQHTLPMRERILEKASEVSQKVGSEQEDGVAGNDKQDFEIPDREAEISLHPDACMNAPKDANEANLESIRGDGQLHLSSNGNPQDIDVFLELAAFSTGANPQPRPPTAAMPIQAVDSFVDSPMPLHLGLHSSITALTGSAIPPGPSLAAPATTTKTFICPTCNKNFTERHNRDRHVKHIHQGKGANKCNHCNKTLSRKEYANRGHQARCSMRPVVG